MKIFIYYNLFLSIVLICNTINILSFIKLNNKNNRDKKKQEDNSTVPYINFYIEEPSRDGLEYIRYEKEIKNETIRIHDLEAYENEDVKLADKILKKQNTNLANLVALEKLTSSMYSKINNY